MAAAAIAPALQSVFAKRGFAWADELVAGSSSPPEGGPARATHEVPVLDDSGVATHDVEVSAQDDPSALFTAVAPLDERVREQLLRELELAETSLVDAITATVGPEAWNASRLRERIASDDDEVDWQHLERIRSGTRKARAAFARQLATAVLADESMPSHVRRCAQDLVDIRARVFRDSVRLAAWIAKGRAFGLDWVLALSGACMGLLTAIDRFEPSRGLALSTYASWWIRHAVERMRHDDAQPLRLPVHASERVGKFRRLEREAWGGLGRPPTVDELAALAAECECSLFDIGAGLRQATVARAGLGGLGERVTDPEIRSPIQGGLGWGWVGRFAPIFDAWLEVAARRADRRGQDRERTLAILNARFGIGHISHETLMAIGNRYGLSRERIRQVQEEALGVLFRVRNVPAHGLGREPWRWRAPDE